MTQQGSGGNVLAAICSFFIPGLGQLVQGRIIPAILFFVFNITARYYLLNIKRLIILYLIFALAMFIIGGAMAMVIRAELFQPGLQFVEPFFFNQMTTMHALFMIFGAVMPAFVGLANWMVPMMIGASDLALPRINNWGFWILPFGSKINSCQNTNRYRSGIC